MTIPGLGVGFKFVVAVVVLMTVVVVVVVPVMTLMVMVVITMPISAAGGVVVGRDQRRNLDEKVVRNISETSQAKWVCMG